MKELERVGDILWQGIIKEVVLANPLLAISAPASSM